MAAVETMRLIVEPGENRRKSFERGGMGVLFKIDGAETGGALVVWEHPRARSVPGSVTES